MGSLIRKSLISLFVALTLSSALPLASAFAASETRPPTILEAPDLTTALRIVPGLTVTVHTFEGLDSHWKEVGDYDFVARVAECEAKGKGFIYDWEIGPPANASGSRKVDHRDVLFSHKVSLFYPKHEVCTLAGYTNVIRVSDALYKDLKEGKTTPFAIDGPESLIVSHAEVLQIPRSIRAEGSENVRIKIEGQFRELRAIKAVCDNGWTYWILDNPHMPMIIQGNAPFRWVVSLGNVNGDLSDANREAKDIYDHLKRDGIATSYLILFDFDKDTLRPQSKEILLSLSKYLKQDKGLRLKVEGHTCTIGGYQYNMDLSRRRARSVKRYLVENCSIDDNRLQSVGYGFTKPEKSNASEQGRARNRRVVFREIK